MTMVNLLLQSHINQQVSQKRIFLHLIVRFGSVSVGLCASLLMKPASYKLPLQWNLRFLGSYGRVIVTVSQLSKTRIDRRTYTGEAGRSPQSTAFSARQMSLSSIG